jgi:hypothetical protein
VHYVKPGGAEDSGEKSCKIYRRLNKGLFVTKVLFQLDGG